MIKFVREDFAFLLLVILWVLATNFLGPVIFALLPLSVFVLRGREQFAEIMFGFLIVLILSDIDPMFVAMRRLKTAKYAYIIALAMIVIIDRRRFVPLAGLFPIFLPFFAYSFLPLVASGSPITGFSKTVSYALLYLVVPNFVLYNFRVQGWEFIRNFIYFVLVVLFSSYLMLYVNPRWVSIAGRYKAYFGNPNALGIFSMLMFMLVYLATSIKKDLFSNTAKWLILASFMYFLIKCGSRTSLTATVMFLLFSRIFAIAPFFGFIAFILFLAIVEYVSSNLATIAYALGLQNYLRVETLEDGSGRYFAWNFAWNQINDGGFFLFGGGFGNDEYIMRQHYPYPRSQGHHGGVHNSYLTMWFNTGIMGILIYFRSFILMFVKASKHTPVAFAVMISVMFSSLYESWLNGSLNPFTIILLFIMTLITEDEILNAGTSAEQRAVDTTVDTDEVTVIGPGAT